MVAVISASQTARSGGGYELLPRDSLVRHALRTSHVWVFDEVTRWKQPSSVSTYGFHGLDHEIRALLAAIYSDLLDKSAELPEVARRVLSDDLWDLYEVV
jgi:hypothetical protein